MKTSELFQVNEVFIGYKRRKFRSKTSAIDSSTKAYGLIRKAIGNKAINHHEEFWIILLDRGLNVLGIAKVFQGGHSSMSVDIKILFQYAIKANASAIILSHNHPSNTFKPSEADIIITKRIIKAGELLGIKILDHVILAESDHFSFKNNNVLL